MAQKTKVKELVGRGLNSYHTKALQQMDRIEKKNKEQNHKISILSNELDNDYLTKTEEGSVISLEHSKEGMVYLDELQGNTLVNYCTDGSKELTLNGDIDIEGTFVTTTEGVDNGKVDVMCEGNTLVNAWTLRDENPYHPNISSNLTSKVTIDTDKTSCKITINENLSLVDGNKWLVFRAYPKQYCRDMIKLNTTYTLIFNLDYNFNLNSNIGVSIANNVSNHFVRNKSFMPKQGLNKVVITTVSEEPEDRTGQHIYIGFPNFLSTDVIGKYFKFSDFYMLEGDWSDKELPSYFEGMQSVGQDDENGHKIEISSQNKNLFKSISSYECNGVKSYDISKDIATECIIGKTVNKITFKADVTTKDFYDNNGHYGIDVCFKFEDGTTQWSNFTKGYALGQIGNGVDITNKKYIYTINLGGKKIKSLSNMTIFSRGNSGSRPTGLLKFENIEIILGEDTSETYVAPKSDKKEILLNEPLRSLPNGVCDKKVKIGNKWYIERNCGEVEVVSTMSISIWGGIPNTINNAFAIQTGIKNKNTDLSSIVFNCDKHIPRTRNYLPNNDVVGICDSQTQGNVLIKLPATNLTEYSIDAFRTWLSNNPFKVVYQLETPTYEPLEIEPTLNTYNDITHISNNSIIPCNMKIQNTGYNAIIKPSTLYTVALDTNKSGTIGMNLGGVKGTTTNNVLKLTTPATLTDDSLRLYGKGIKGSKVRLLEGDKTNWMPSFFEGMKSSFEDKVQDDGSYKMEILSNNKNLWVANNKTAQKDNLTVEFDHDTQIITVNGVCNIDDLYIYQGREYIIKDIPKNELNYTLSYEIVSGSYDITNSVRNSFGYIGISSREFGTTINIGGLNMISGNSVSFKMKNQPNNTWFRLDKGTVFNNLKLKISLEPYIRKTDYVKPSFNKIQFSSIEPLRSLPSGVKDKFIFKNGKLMIERNTSKTKITSDMNFARSYDGWANIVFACEVDGLKPIDISTENVYCNILPYFNIVVLCNTLGRTGVASHNWINNRNLQIAIKGIDTVDKLREWISERDMEIVYQIEPKYEEIPFELQKIILEGYENGTLFFDTNIPPTSTVTYAGETPIVKATKLNKTEVSNNTADINDNILPYLMDMDYRIVMLQLATEGNEGEVSMARLFGGTYEMLKRDILSKRLSRQEYGYRLADYFNAGKLTEEQVRELEELR